MSTTSTAHEVSRNVRARHLQKAPNPVASTTTTSTWQEQVANEVEAALDSMHPTEQAHVMAQLHTILSARPSNGPHCPALSHSHACSYKCPWSELANRLDGCTRATALGWMLLASSRLCPLTTSDCSHWLPAKLCPNVLRLPACLQVPLASHLLSEAKSAQLMSQHLQKRCQCLLAHSADPALSCIVPHPWTMQMSALNGQQGTKTKPTSWWGRREHCNATTSPTKPRISLLATLEVTSWPSISILLYEIRAVEAGRSQRLFSCLNTCLHANLDASANPQGSNPMFMTSLIVHSGSTPQHTNSSWRFFHHEVHRPPWLVMELMSPPSLPRPTLMTPRQLMTSRVYPILGDGEIWCTLPPKTTWHLHRRRPAPEAALGQLIGEQVTAQPSPPPPAQGPDVDWSGSRMLDPTERTELAWDPMKGHEVPSGGPPPPKMGPHGVSDWRASSGSARPPLPMHAGATDGTTALAPRGSNGPPAPRPLPTGPLGIISAPAGPPAPANAMRGPAGPPPPTPYNPSHVRPAAVDGVGPASKPPMARPPPRAPGLTVRLPSGLLAQALPSTIHSQGSYTLMYNNESIWICLQPNINVDNAPGAPAAPP